MASFGKGKEVRPWDVGGKTRKDTISSKSKIDEDESVTMRRANKNVSFTRT